MYFVLIGRGSIYLAEWLGQDLGKRKLVSDFNETVLISGIGRSATDKLVAVVGLDGYQFAVFFIDVSTGDYRKVFKEGEGGSSHSIFDIAFAPGGQAIAFLSTTPPEVREKLSTSTDPGAHNDIFVYDLVKQQAKLLTRGKAFSALSWTPNGEQLTYGTRDGWIESVSVQSGRTERLFEGTFPAWSPDGSKLAYSSEDTVLIYDTKRKKAERVYKPWLRHLFSNFYWSPDSRYVSFTVEFGGGDLLGLRFLSCVVVDVNSGKSFSVSSGGLECGPWLPAAL